MAMPLGLKEDRWINEQAATHSVSELEDCAIAVDATYYLRNYPDHEPLISALGGLAGIKQWIESDLDRWKEHRVTPFFIFDGQTITGQDEVSVIRGRHANDETNHAWDLYANNRPEEAVAAFGINNNAFRPQVLYPLLQSILKKRQLHFLVPPYNAAAQLVYFDMIDSDQCAGIMGFQELLLYPIKDCIIRSIDWKTKTVTAISKKHVVKALNVSEVLFVDAFLMTGTSFLPAFPPLLDPTIIKGHPSYTIVDAVNILRTSDKSVMQACNSFSDILTVQDPNWLDKYRKARMVVSHFIYIAENGEIKVNDYDRLTQDNHEYLGYQLPSELFHYVNTGLIGPRILSWITHGQLYLLPTLDGLASDEYKRLVSSQLVPLRQTALGLLIPRLNRGIGYKEIKMRAWYDRNFSQTVWEPSQQNANYHSKAASWSIKESTIREHFPDFAPGSILSEIRALRKPEFASLTAVSPREKIKGLDSADAIVSICIWRFLHLRDYIGNSHELTAWGSALETAMSALEPAVKQNPEVPFLYESVLMAFELLRFGLLHTKNKHPELGGLPMHGTEDDKSSLLLISRCATLLKLRHGAIGYTGPLSKNLLAYRSLVAEVRAADRDLTEAIVASTFVVAQATRHRDDYWELGHRLPFLFEPDISLAIAIKTWLDDSKANESPAERAERMASFPDTYLPHALNLTEDLNICYAFFDAIHAGIKTLDSKDFSTADRAVWDTAAKYLAARR